MATRVIVHGLAGSVPVGGMGLHYLQFCLGLRDLGCEVLYLEEGTGTTFSPVDGSVGDNGATARWLADMFGRFNLDWSWQDPDGDYHGWPERAVTAFGADADLLLSISMSYVPGRQPRRARAVALVDTDPGFGQVRAAQGDAAMREIYESFDLLFSFAEAIGTSSCRLPTSGLPWKPTRQPVHLPLWAEAAGEAPGDTWTTVMNWDAYGEIEVDGETWGMKRAEFPVVADLPRRTGLPLEVAVTHDAPWDELRAAGWRVVAPFPVSRTIWDLRNYIAASRGELTVQKQSFVRARSGWFAERSANYLAAGRPVVAQDTGWSALLPTGQGLFAFSTTDEAEAGLRAVEADPAGHAAAARAVAERWFDATVVLDRLLSDAAVG